MGTVLCPIALLRPTQAAKHKLPRHAPSYKRTQSFLDVTEATLKAVASVTKNL